MHTSDSPFATAELGRKVSKDDYQQREQTLRTQLLEVQRAARSAGLSVIIVASGVEGAGKSDVVNRLCEWFDTRNVAVHAFWDETDDERQRPRYWRFWRRLPPRGSIGVMFGSWYTMPIIDSAFGRTTAEEFERELRRINRFEETLTDEGALIVKLWFHISSATQAKRIADEKKRGKSKKKGHRSREWKVSPLAHDYSLRYDEFSVASGRAIRTTDTPGAPWHVVEATQARYRDLTTGEIILEAMTRRLATMDAPQVRVASPAPEIGRDERTVFDEVDLDAALDDEEYSRQLARWQRRLYDVSWEAYRRRTATIAVFEGWDAAGKGGAIRRATAALDARIVRTIPIAAPTDEERAQHYLWRFWRQIPRAGYIRFFDRSWYGRVLVERVEGFATPEQWQRAYHEINEFEDHLQERGVAIVKFWLHISPEEQLRRFEERKDTAWKLHKLTDEDWRNRERWSAYEAAAGEMIERTTAPQAPWVIVAANNKRHARVQVVRSLCKRMEEAVES